MPRVNERAGCRTTGCPRWWCSSSSLSSDTGRRRGVEDGAEDEENEGDGEDKPTPTVPIKSGDGVGVARRGVIPSCCCEGVDMGDSDDGENKPTPVTPMEEGVPSLDMKPARRKL